VTPSELERIEKLAEEATPGPWTANCDYVNNTEGFICNTGTTEDADFIAAIRNAFPAMAAEMKRLMEIEKATRERYDAWVKYSERSWHGDEAEADAWVKYLRADQALVAMLEGGASE
jgi:hypothetical protein